MTNPQKTLQNVPVIDLRDDDDSIAQQMAHACATFGFFQIVHHGVPQELMERFRTLGKKYFKEYDNNEYRRNASNARGYFDDELTKQKLDWKQCLDVGVPGSRDWHLPDDDPRNACLDGFNQFRQDFPAFRDTLVEYFTALESLSDRLARLMALGLHCEHDPILDDLQKHHTSYLRLNYYPPVTNSSKENDDVLGISPHKDAGFLTILLQDETCFSLQVLYQDEWHTIVPETGSFTINTGDMAQIWSNGKYQAPLHRVLTNEKERFSAPFFYNPGYHSHIQPIKRLDEDSEAKYRPCNWGYFRAVRFAGDFTDLGVEIQIDDYEMGNHSSPHEKLQEQFGEHFSVDEPFNVKDFARFLEQHKE